MVSVRKKRIGNQDYYYLEHSIRKGSRVEKKQVYLGRNIPKSIDKLKRELLAESSNLLLAKFNRIRTNFRNESGRIPETARRKDAVDFATRFTYNTNRIEGSTLTFRETARLLENGITPSQRPISDVKESEAQREIFEDMLVYKKELTLQIILYWHRRLFMNTKQDIAGRIRAHQVAISGSKFIPPFPAEIQPLLIEFFKWYSKNRRRIHPVELAALVHQKVVTIHPFTDGNGRISRLLMNFVLNIHRFPMLIIPYERRISYYNALERSQVNGQEGIFVQWFFRRYLKEYERYAKPGKLPAVRRNIYKKIATSQ